MKYKNYSFLAEKRKRRNYFLLGNISGAILLLLLMLLSKNISAESVWTDDGDLVITDNNAIVWVNDEGSVDYVVPIESNETNFIYGKDKLTVCQPTNNGSICY